MDALLANITWNPYGWGELYINKKAGHKYAQDHPGHESLNFKFDKKGIDTADKLYGYIHWTYPPRKFTNGGVILFYSKNPDTKENKVVGVYGNADILKPPISKKYQGFENNELSLNVIALKSHSLLFPIPLNTRNYKADLRSQVGYKNIELDLAGKIIKDELTELSKSEGTVENFKEEFKKLGHLYKSITGNNFFIIQISLDEKEQDELSKIIAHQDRAEIIKELEAVKPASPKKITVGSMQYLRDNKTIAQLKFLREFKCQICNSSVLKKDGSLYVEAAHILEKRYQGPETPENILILCPNHHKEFDLGKREIIEHTKSLIKFELNGVPHEIDLSLK